MTVDMEVDAADDMVQRLRRGEPAAFDEIFNRHFDPLTRFVARMVDSQHVAAELVQDVFLRLWSGRAQLAVRGDLRSYLRRAARNRALDWLGRENLHRRWSETAQHEIATPHDDERASDDSRFSLMYEVLNQTLAAMPERRRAACELRWREGLSPPCIAERLDVSLKTVETHLTRGAKDVRAMLTLRRKELA